MQTLISIVDGFDTFFLYSDIMNLLRSIMVKYYENTVIMQNCLLSLYYLSNISDSAPSIFLNNMDSTMLQLLEEFVEKNQHDQSIVQRFSKIREKLGKI